LPNALVVAVTMSPVSRRRASQLDDRCPARDYPDQLGL